MSDALILEIYRLLDRAETIDGVARALGTLDDESFAPIQVGFAPKDERFSRGTAIADVAGPTTIQVRLDTNRLSLRDVEAIFGTLEPNIKLHFDDPVTLLTDIEREEFNCGFRVIAVLQASIDAASPTAAVASVTIRRQPKLSTLRSG